MMNTKSTKFLVRTLFFALFFSFGNFFAQNNGAVGINTASPNPNSVLDVVSVNNNKGILIPRLTVTQRDAITINPANDDGLTVYNTTEDCLNYWSLADNEWKSVCGQIGKSVFTIDCANTKASGTYIQGKTLNTSHYLTVTVNVTKKGSYTITGTTTNGYNFYATGVFLNTGIQTVQVAGQGTPSAVQSDTVQLFANGVSVSCTPAVTVNVLSSAATYSVSCGSATVNGVYTKGTALGAGNTITLPVTVTALGSYSITTNTVDGISFSGSGIFTATGNQNITLSGTGKPTSTADKVMTITSNSADGESTCNVTVVMTIPSKKILHIGLETVYGYSAFTGPSRSLMDSPTNFGTSAASVVKSGGYTHTSLGGAPSNATLLAALNTKPDIVIISYAYTPDATASGYIANYLNNKGVVIAFEDDAASSQNMMRAIFSDPTISAANGAGAGSVYALVNTNDPILNGPFGDVRGKNWGEDASTTVNITGLTSGFIPYSYAQPINSTTPRTGISGLRHSSLNFIWFGDGGFLSNENANGNQYPSNTIEPFVAPSSGGYLPVQKSTYGYAGNGYALGGMQVQNSIIFANALAWAIKQAETNGINTQ
ncbi:hypothetical protein QX233_08490 [Chryseobacterium gambrini]|uniref:Ig-like domain (Group 3) n=1 Tax=Chryseobacterium gambrini TaxID=373672 RepID=A0AAJ1R2L3_9FLAO|nr:MULTISPECIES: hypothetical protein [Chryseobacterium]MDN4012493.1 hypothetical protein [Chryseobacterium gambrini]QWA37344.1 hypothetical protein KKI44_15585 [Chryseobacterium sp. ZHDP1]